MSDAPVRVGLFVTCLVDLFRPSVGFAAVKLLEEAGCTVEVPLAQTCCGQPAYNSGDTADTRAIARQVIDAFEGFDYVVAPSGSCAGMIREHYPALFAEMPGAETCCGFGGTFCIKYPEISTRMVDDKATDIVATGADTLLAGDLG